MDIVIIGGSGAEGVIDELGVSVDKKEHLEEPTDIHGMDYLSFGYQGNNVFFVLRHGKDHQRDPARLEPKYMAKRLSELVENPEESLLIQTSASGSLDTSIQLIDEGGIVVCSDVMRGYGFRGSSRSRVETEELRGNNLHAVISQAYSPLARDLAIHAINETKGATSYEGGIYVNNQGNQFESKAEVAALYSWLDTPRRHLASLGREKELLVDLLVGLKQVSHVKLISLLEEVNEEEKKYAQVNQNLTINNAQLSMNAGREIEPLIESGFRNNVLLAFPVNYGTGLIPDEQVNHQRTEGAIKVGMPYIVGTLKKMIQEAPNYIK